MNSVKELFNKIGRRRVEKQVAGWSQYKKLLIDLVSEKDVDPDHAKMLLDTIGKSPQELESDVSTMAKRIEAAKRFEQHGQAQKDLADADQELASLREQLAVHHRKFDPLINAACEKRQAIENTLTATSNSENELIRTCRDPEILEREKTIREAMAQFQPRILELTEQRDLSRAALGGAKNGIDKWSKELRISAGDANTEYCKKNLEQAQRNAGVYESNLAKAQIEIQDIERQRKAFDEELGELRKKKLTV